jgi:hypothetical protein
MACGACGKPVIDGVVQLLFAAEISLGGLDSDMPQH